MPKRSPPKLSLTERMRRITKKDTRPELAVRSILHAMGYRFRLHLAQLPGSPDIVLPRHRKVIFVHGCFWHRHSCHDGMKLPRSKPGYWLPKLERNRLRDEAAVAELRLKGWAVLVLWECQIRDAALTRRTLQDFLRDTGASPSELAATVAPMP